MESWSHKAAPEEQDTSTHQSLVASREAVKRQSDDDGKRTQRSYWSRLKRPVRTTMLQVMTQQPMSQQPDDMTEPELRNPITRRVGPMFRRKEG